MQAIAEHFPNTWVVPGLNTSFLGLPTEQGVWAERCAALWREFLTAARALRVLNAGGKLVTPGLIDCHSHIAISRGVNEATDAVTVEVRIGDVLDPTDINLYRQLAGAHPHLAVYRRAEVPARWHYSDNPRIAPIVAVRSRVAAIAGSLILLAVPLAAQRSEPSSLAVLRITEPVRLDGRLDEPASTASITSPMRTPAAMSHGARARIRSSAPGIVVRLSAVSSV